jgi:predicted acylesterase/phospholipase RssA
MHSFGETVRRHRRGGPALAVGAGLASLLSLAGCAVVESLANTAIRSKDILGMQNQVQGLAPPPPEAEEIERIYRRALTDAYWDFWTKREADPFDASIAAEPLTRAIWCTGTRITPSADRPPLTMKPCFDELFAALHLPPQDPALPLAYEKVPSPGARRERDIIRVETLLEASVLAAVTFLRSNYPQSLRESSTAEVLPADWAPVRDGVAQGLRKFTAYQLAHARVATRDRSPTAIALSGGGANGAFSAGGVWFLLHQLAKCKECAGKARIDMVAAASTGALIGVLVKDFFAGGPEHQPVTLATLTDSYLCSVDADLYCVTDAGIVDLGITGAKGQETGIVRFSGISRMLDAHIDQGTFASPVEFFATTTEFKSGRLLYVSSADPAQITDSTGLKQEVLSSIPEPGLAEPIYHVGKLSGFFIDGGIRSGLPVLPAILGGAEHMVAFVNQESNLLPRRVPPANALGTLFRAIDLFTFQPIVGELSQGEYELATRRAAEYELCMDRAKERAKSASVDYETANCFCAYLTPGAQPQPGARGKPALHALEALYQSSQVFQPRQIPAGFEGDAYAGSDLIQLNSAAYAFSPPAMWRQFVLGAATVQERCVEIATALGWLPQTPFACEGASTLKAELDALRARLTAQGCYKKSMDVRTCGPSDPPISRP